MMRPPRVIGRRGAVLAYLALVDLLYALSLFRPVPEGIQAPTTRFLVGIMPLPIWATLWLVVGAVCLVAAFVHRLDRVAFACATAIKTLWGGVFVLGWLAGGILRGWVSGAVWLALAVLVAIIAGWPEPRER